MCTIVVGDASLHVFSQQLNFTINMYFAGQFITIHKKQYILRRDGDI